MLLSQVRGTAVECPVVRVVDGDTIVVEIQGTEESLRLLGIDTEESRRGGRKPMTSWGVEAKKAAQSFFPEGEGATVEFPGDEPVEECLTRYRDNYGRPLVFVHRGEEDFQERTIRQGFSPYFTKYGYAECDDHHRRYREAERQAQADDAGVWSQLAVNGAEIRDYSALCTWWELRAEVVERYRRAVAEGTDVLDSRLDYEEITNRIGEEVVVFTELRDYWPVGASHVVVTIGSQSQPFKLFLPEARATEAGQRLLSLLDQRYVAEDSGTTVAKPHRSYAYVSGELQLCEEEPEIEVTEVGQITDEPPE
jgi:micrococcal nuclease